MLGSRDLSRGLRYSSTEGLRSSGEGTQKAPVNSLPATFYWFKMEFWEELSELAIKGLFQGALCHTKLKERTLGKTVPVRECPSGVPFSKLTSILRRMCCSVRLRV